MSGHVHRFHRLTWAGTIGLTKWRCACGIKLRDARLVAKLEGKSL